MPHKRNGLSRRGRPNAHLTADSITLKRDEAVRVVRDNRVEAISGLKAEIQRRVATGELLSLEIDTVGISSLAGKYAGDPTLTWICDEAYKLRDAEPSE
jgi:hypothetical protein